MWVWVTVVGLLVEVGVIVALGRAATQGSEQDARPAPAPRPRAPRPGPVGAQRTVPLAFPVTVGGLVSHTVRQAAHHGAPAARR